MKNDVPQQHAKAIWEHSSKPVLMDVNGAIRFVMMPFVENIGKSFDGP